MADKIREIQHRSTRDPLALSFAVKAPCGDGNPNEEELRQSIKIVLLTLKNLGFAATDNLYDTSKIRVKRSSRRHNFALNDTYLEKTIQIITPFIPSQNQEDFNVLLQSLENAGIFYQQGALVPFKQEQILPCHSGEFEYALTKRERHQIIRIIFRNLSDEEKFDTRVLKYLDSNGTIREDKSGKIDDEMSFMISNFKNYHEMKLSSDLALAQKADEYKLNISKIIGREIEVPNFKAFTDKLKFVPSRSIKNPKFNRVSEQKNLRFLYRGMTHSDPYANVGHVGSRFGLTFGSASFLYSLGYSNPYKEVTAMPKIDGSPIGFITEYVYGGNDVLEDWCIEAEHFEPYEFSRDFDPEFSEAVVHSEVNPINNIYITKDPPGGPIMAARVPLEDPEIKKEYAEFARWTKPTIYENPLIEPLYREALANGGKLKAYSLFEKNEVEINKLYNLLYDSSASIA